MTGRVLCVDDDEQVRGLIQRGLDSAGHECIPAATASLPIQAMAHGGHQELDGAQGVELRFTVTAGDGVRGGTGEHAEKERSGVCQDKTGSGGKEAKDASLQVFPAAPGEPDEKQ